MRGKVKVVLYGLKGKDVIGEQTSEEILQRIRYGEIVTVLQPFFNQEGFIKWCKEQGTPVVVEDWKSEPGLQVYIKDEDGLGLDVDGNKFEGEEL